LKGALDRPFLVMRRNDNRKRMGSVSSVHTSPTSSDEPDDGQDDVVDADDCREADQRGGSDLKE